MYVIAVVNAGSSSIKFGIFDIGGDEPLLLRGQVEKIGVRPTLTVEGPAGDGTDREIERGAPEVDHKSAPGSSCKRPRAAARRGVEGIGHRVVHGGTDFTARSSYQAVTAHAGEAARLRRCTSRTTWRRSK